MPQVIVYAAAGKTEAQHHQLLKKITEAVVESYEIPAEIVTVQIIEALTHLKAKAGIRFCDR
ncbi:tautomerase family protein [Pseudomonas sp. MS19]|uniref:tautomerase family protein n=1 Tax=Pseudomonas sp. MS19 TaxID=2579939 RepID=UPI00156200B8|nr:tautomerase family protein [Pseudomonas sp. MS19]NRH26584.1 4-oxalocrotonate tautomerase [Pseudomonas sp. MS19]